MISYDITLFVTRFGKLKDGVNWECHWDIPSMKITEVKCLLLSLRVFPVLNGV